MKPSRAISAAKLPPAGTPQPLLSQQTGGRVWPRVFLVEVLASPRGPGPHLILPVGVEAGREISQDSALGKRGSAGTFAPIGRDPPLTLQHLSCVAIFPLEKAPSQRFCQQGA